MIPFSFFYTSSPSLLAAFCLNLNGQRSPKLHSQSPAQLGLVSKQDLDVSPSLVRATGQLKPWEGFEKTQETLPILFSASVARLVLVPRSVSWEGGGTVEPSPLSLARPTSLPFFQLCKHCRPCPRPSGAVCPP